MRYDSVVKHVAEWRKESYRRAETTETAYYCLEW